MIVYKITNSITFDFYIGCTKYSIAHRFKQHVNKSKYSKTKFHQSIKKYGEESFELEVLYVAKYILEMYMMEALYIEYCQANIARFPYGSGLNLSDGGEYPPSNFKSPRSQSHKDNLSKANLGKKLSDEHKKKLSEAHKGKKHSDEHILKCVKSRMKNGKTRKPVSCYEFNGTLVATYESGVHAEKETGINRSHISQVCKGKRNQTGGFIWKYTE